MQAVLAATVAWCACVVSYHPPHMPPPMGHLQASSASAEIIHETVTVFNDLLPPIQDGILAEIDFTKRSSGRSGSPLCMRWYGRPRQTPHPVRYGARDRVLLCTRPLGLRSVWLTALCKRDDFSALGLQLCTVSTGRMIRVLDLFSGGTATYSRHMHRGDKRK